MANGKVAGFQSYLFQNDGKIALAQALRIDNELKVRLFLMKKSQYNPVPFIGHGFGQEVHGIVPKVFER